MTQPYPQTQNLPLISGEKDNAGGQTVYCYFWAYPFFLLFSFSVLHFLVVGSMRSIEQLK